ALAGEARASPSPPTRRGFEPLVVSFFIGVCGRELRSAADTSRGWARPLQSPRLSRSRERARGPVTPTGARRQAARWRAGPPEPLPYLSSGPAGLHPPGPTAGTARPGPAVGRAPAPRPRRTTRGIARRVPLPLRAAPPPPHRRAPAGRMTGPGTRPFPSRPRPGSPPAQAGRSLVG